MFSITTTFAKIDGRKMREVLASRVRVVSVSKARIDVEIEIYKQVLLIRSLVFDLISKM